MFDIIMETKSKFSIILARFLVWLLSKTYFTLLRNNIANGIESNLNIYRHIQQTNPTHAHTFRGVFAETSAAGTRLTSVVDKSPKNVPSTKCGYEGATPPHVRLMAVGSFTKAVCNFKFFPKSRNYPTRGRCMVIISLF